MQQIIMFGIMEAIKYSPEIEKAVRDLFTKTDATREDWLAAIAKFPRVSYESVVKDSGLIPS